MPGYCSSQRLHSGPERMRFSFTFPEPFPIAFPKSVAFSLSIAYNQSVSFRKPDSLAHDLHWTAMRCNFRSGT